MSQAHPMEAHLWRLSDDIVPMHMHDSEEEVLVHAGPGGCEVLSGPRQASEIAAAGALAEADGEGAASGVTRRTVLASMAALGALGMVSATPRYAFAETPPRETPSSSSSCAGRSTGCRSSCRSTIRTTGARGPAWRSAPTMRCPPPTASASTPRCAPSCRCGRPGSSRSSMPSATRSHFDAQLDMERAAPAAVRSGWLGRHLAATSRSTDLTRAVTVGNRAAVSVSGFPTASFTGTLENGDIWAWPGHRRGIHATLARMHRSAGGTVGADASRAMAGVASLARARATKAGTAPYPDDVFGKGMREIARVIRSGAPVEAACIDLDGWDLHRDHGGPFDQWGPMRMLVDSLATALAAFRTDLGVHWGRTTVLPLSEFGRRVEQNSIGGTDHGHGNLMFVAGGNVVGGRIHGRWPGLAPSALLDGDLAITTDYRDVVSEILAKRLRTPNLRAVFPGHTARPVGVVR